MGEINSHRDLLVWQQAMERTGNALPYRRRVGLADMNSVAGILERGESVGKLLRLRMRKLDDAN